MSGVKLFAVLTLIAFIGVVTSFTFSPPNQDDSPSQANCTACETIYNVALSHVKPEYIANDTLARSFMLGECNMFRQQQVPFWTFCFEMYTQHFDAFWQDLKSSADPTQACTALGICQ